MSFRGWLAEKIDPEAKYDRLEKRIADQQQAGPQKALASAKVTAPDYSEGRPIVDEKSMTPAQLEAAWVLGRPLFKKWDTDTAIAEGFEASSWTYICVDKLARSAMAVDWQAQAPVDGDADQWEVASESDLHGILQEPNDKWTTSELIYRIVCGLYLGGNALVSKIRDGLGDVREIWTIGPNGISPIPDQEEFISAYEYQRHGRIEQFAPENIIHMLFPDPRTPYWGLSPMMPGSKAIEIDREAAAFQKNAFQNRGVPGGLLAYNKALSEKQYKQSRKQVNEQISGAENARKMMVLGNDVRYEQLAMSPDEMDYLESRKLTREEICAVHGVPPPTVGVYENATLANVETARKILWTDTVLPLLDKVAEELTKGLRDEFDGDAKLRVGYDASKIDALWQVFAEKIEKARALWEMGVPFNEINARFELGFNPTAIGEQSFVASGVMPADAMMVDTFTDEE